MEEVTKINGTSNAHSAEIPAPTAAPAAAPVALLSSVRELLGRVSVDGAPSSEKGASNSTRWVMEVELGASPLSIGLITRYGKAIAIETLGISMAPLNESYWAAKPYISRDPEHGLVLHTAKNWTRGVPNEQRPARFLLTIDAILPHELRNA